MMEDIAPDLLKKIQADFQSSFDKSTVISELYEKVRDGTATYLEANKFAIETGDILAEAYKNNLSSAVLPDGKMYYNIAQRIIEPTMENNYSLITDVTNQVQKSLNEAAGVGIKAITPELNRDRIEKIVDRVADAEQYDDIAWILDEPVKNFSQSIVDDSIRTNAEFHYDAGLKSTITRKLSGGCCKWCRALAGIYNYPDVPKDVYRRHQRCRCFVGYNVGKYSVNVHNKRSYDDKGNAVNRRNFEKGILKVRNKEEAAFVENVLEEERVRNEKKRLNQMISEYQQSENVSHRRAANRIGRMLRADEVDNAIKEYRKSVGLSSSKLSAEQRILQLKNTLENQGKSSTMKLEDIVIHKSVGAKAKNYNVLDSNTGEYFHFAEDTSICNVEVFAGKGTKKTLHEGVAEGLSEQIGGKPENWQHCKGHGVIDYYGEERPAEVHWFQEETVGKVKFKVKRWEDEN